MDNRSRQHNRIGPGRLPARSALAALVAYFVTAVLLQFHGGASGCVLGGDPDAPAHYVTGLMVRDYIAAGMPGSPMAYAENFYLHYPKVALGHWPPLFYLVQAAWTLPFSPSPTSVLLLMAVITALLAAGVCKAIREDFSTVAAAAAGFLMLSLPLVQQLNRTVMADLLVALLVFQATLVFGRYLDSERWQDNAWFGIWASLALLTKGSGIVLVLLPPLSLLLARRVRLAMRWSFWLPAFIVLAVCGPWYLFAPGAEHQAVMPYGRLGFKFWRLWLAPGGWSRILGAAPSVVVVLGIWWVVRRRLGSGDGAGKWAAALSLLVGLVLLPSVVFAAEQNRHLVLGVPVLLMFLVAGVAWITARFSVPVRSVLLLVPAVAWFAYNVSQVAPEACRGFEEIAQDVLPRPELGGSVILVSSDATGEGMLVAEIAMREKRPGHIVLRASKLLADVSWMGGAYRPLVHTPAEVMQLLEGIPVGVLIMDLSPRIPYEHHHLLLDVLHEYPERWERIAAERQNRKAGGVLVAYRLKGHEGKALGRIRLDMRRSLGRYIER